MTVDCFAMILWNVSSGLFLTHWVDNATHGRYDYVQLSTEECCVWPVQIGSESLPTSLIVFHYTMSQKGSSTFFVYKLNKHYLTLIIFGRNVTQKLSTQKLVYFPAHLNLTSASALRCRTRKQHLFSQTFYYCFARLQPVDDSQFILTLQRDSMRVYGLRDRLALGCWAPMITRSKKVEGFALQQLICVARTMRSCAVFLKDKILNHDVFDSS